MYSEKSGRTWVPNLWNINKRRSRRQGSQFCKWKVEELSLKIVDKIDFLDIMSVKINRGEPIEEMVKGFDFL